MPRPLAVVLALSFASFPVACGSPKATDFLTAEADSKGTGGSGSSQGGSATGGAGGGMQGGAPATGGSATGGIATGGSATGGSATGGDSGAGMGGMATGGTSGSGAGTDTGGLGGGALGGSAGSGGGPSECEMTIMQAEQALRLARACDPNSGGMLCTGSVEDLCGCSVPVEKQESEETKNYLALRDAALRCGVACPAIPCAAPTDKTVCFLGDSASCIYLR